MLAKTTHDYQVHREELLGLLNQFTHTPNPHTEHLIHNSKTEPSHWLKATAEQNNNGIVIEAHNLYHTHMHTHNQLSSQAHAH